MKKLIYLTALLFAFTSCSSDDENINSASNAVDLIVGVWKPISEVQVVDGVQETDSYTCGEVITFTFLENGDYTQTLFSKDDDNNCIENTEYNITGTWEYLINNNYKLITIIENVITSQTTEVIEEYEISFSGSNSMTIYSNFDPNDDDYNVSVLFNKVQ